MSQLDVIGTLSQYHISEMNYNKGGPDPSERAKRDRQQSCLQELAQAYIRWEQAAKKATEVMDLGAMPPSPDEDSDMTWISKLAFHSRIKIDRAVLDDAISLTAALLTTKNDERLRSLRAETLDWQDPAGPDYWRRGLEECENTDGFRDAYAKIKDQLKGMKIRQLCQSASTVARLRVDIILPTDPPANTDPNVYSPSHVIKNSTLDSKPLSRRPWTLCLMP